MALGDIRGQGRGVVVSFDSPVGLGQVRDEEGSEFRFHCTQIADGSREIAVGTEVMFDLIASRRGQLEAARVRRSDPNSG